jgi:thioredoxin 2
MEITQDLLQEKINNGEKLIVDFWAPWCGPCRMMKPVFERVAGEVNASESGVKMYTLNVEENRDLAASLGIRAIPTVKGFNGGSESFTKSGVLAEAQLKEFAQDLLNG